MTKKLPISAQRRILALAVCSALAAMVSPAYADQTLDFNLFRDSATMFRDGDMSRWSENYVEFGVGYNSRSSFKFGEYTGLTDKGGFPLAGFNWLNRDSDNDTQFWRIHGANLGLDSHKLQAEGGVQGKWGVIFSFDQLKRSQTESAVFLHQGLGTSALTLPAGYTRVATANLVNSGVNSGRLLSPFEIKQGRDVYRMGLNGELASGWAYKVSFREDQSDGTRLTGLTRGFSPVIVPYPIDERTRQIEATLSYATKVAQLQLGYTYSKFDNSVRQFDVQNPYASATLPNLRLSLAPGNDFHQFNANGAYNISKASRLTGKFSYGIARQNDDFLPYSANGAAATTALPRNSLDGKIVNTLLDLALTTKPVDKMNLKLGYQYRDSDNRTPIANFIYAGSDGATVGAVNSSSNRTNAPLSTTEQRVTVEADYQIAARTTLRAGLERSHKTYSTSDRSMTNTDKLSLEVRRPVSDEFLGSLGYVFTRRTGSEYDANRLFRETYASAYRLGAPRSTNTIPSLRSYMYSDYDENRLRASGNWTVSETVTLQGGVDNYRQRSRGPDCASVVDPAVAAQIGVAMPDICLGRKLADGVALNLDLQWQPDADLMTFGFANFAETRTDQTGRNAGTTPWTDRADPTRDYSITSTYRDTTVGLGLKWQPQEKWDLGGTYALQQSRGLTNFATGSAVIAGTFPATPLPDLTTRLHTLQLYAKLAYSKQLSWRFSYNYENLKSYDWSYDVYGPTSVAGILQTGQTSPRYSNHVFGVSAIVKSW